MPSLHNQVYYNSWTKAFLFEEILFTTLKWICEWYTWKESNWPASLMNIEANIFEMLADGLQQFIKWMHFIQY